MAITEKAVTTGYATVSEGSKVDMFLGTNQAFFMGGKTALTIGTTNTATLGMKSDLFLGPSVNINLGWGDWDAKAKGFQKAHLTAKYDFSTNKNFAFQISKEGSSTYATSAKFNCTEGFQAIGGLSLAGLTAYEAYTTTITTYATAIAIINVLLGLETVVDAMSYPKDSEMNIHQQRAAVAVPTTLNLAVALATQYAALQTAIAREDVFKGKIHPESVIQLTNNRVFLGSAGGDNPALYSIRAGANLSLSGGKAILGSRYLSMSKFTSPYEKASYYPGSPYVDFADKRTAAVEVDRYKIQSYANKISIKAGGTPEKDLVNEAVKKAEKQAFDQLRWPAMASGTWNSTTEAAAQKVAYAAGLVARTSAEGAAAIAENPDLLASKLNPSLFLEATGGLASKIEAKAPKFDVLSGEISITNNLGNHGLVVSQSGNSITIKHSTGAKISVDATGNIKLISAGTSLEITGGPLPQISAKIPGNSITLKTDGVWLQAGTSKVAVMPGLFKVGNSFKTIVA